MLVKQGSVLDKLILLLPSWAGFYMSCRVGNDYTTFRRWSLRPPIAQ